MPLHNIRGSVFGVLFQQKYVSNNSHWTWTLNELSSRKVNWNLQTQNLSINQSLNPHVDFCLSPLIRTSDARLTTTDRPSRRSNRWVMSSWKTPRPRTRLTWRPSWLTWTSTGRPTKTCLPRGTANYFWQPNYLNPKEISLETFNPSVEDMLAKRYSNFFLAAKLFKSQRNFFGNF